MTVVKNPSVESTLDAENRQPWKGILPAPTFPTFEIDDIKSEVEEIIQNLFADHPGTLDISTIPATRKEVLTRILGMRKL